MSGLYPGAIDLNEGTLSVDAALSNPTVIEERVADLISGNVLVDTLFAPGGPTVQGGAVIYSKITEKYLYPDVDVADRSPGDQYAQVWSTPPELELAKVQDFGGKVSITEEARKRNSAVVFDNEITTLSNAITRRLNKRAMETIDAAVTGSEDVLELQAAAAWNTTLAVGPEASKTDPRQLPGSDFGTAIAHAQRQDLGVEYSKLIVSPENAAHLRNTYGATLGTLLDDHGLDMITSNYVAAGDAYLVDPKKLGFVSYEEPLTVHTWDDPEHRLHWVQAYACPVMGVTLPSAVAVIRGTNS
ncbi:major capsid protein [Corynebacterium variabile]|uniref:major capsid protein n=1 Tax=Corynebacterium variabile TaxID=1727 RepID=UPI003FD16F39